MEAGKRVMASITRFLEKRLHLHVNQEKSAVAPVWERKFPGHRLLLKGRLAIAPKSVERTKERVRRITRRNRGIALKAMTQELNEFLTGWVTYFRHTECKETLHRLDEWIRHKVRCFRLKQCKRVKTIADFLQEQGVTEHSAWMMALSGKGWWRLSGTPQAHQAMSSAWMADQGIASLTDRYLSLQT